MRPPTKGSGPPAAGCQGQCLELLWGVCTLKPALWGWPHTLQLAAALSVGLRENSLLSEVVLRVL